MECSQKWKNVIQKIIFIGTGQPKNKKIGTLLSFSYAASLKILLLLQEDINITWVDGWDMRNLLRPL